MVQKGLALNKAKQQKGGRRHINPHVSKVDVLRKKKKAESSGILGAAITKSNRKLAVRLESTLSGKAQVEGNCPALQIVKVSPQILAKARARVGGIKQKNKSKNKGGKKK
mmetsp:Transcript_54156/g.116974  ORF Transcript_54156/g.116974 Transcript_54156/m.116974 type:complete len:110 (-) Transcript_54156:114-443(-)